MNIKKVLLSILLIVIIAGIVAVLVIARGKVSRKTDKKLVVVSNFASYDFVRAIIGDDQDIELKFLVGPGKEMHSYEPTTQDIVDIQSSDLFVYIGGDSEKWSDKVIDSWEGEKNVLKISDYVDTMEEQEIDGAEKESVEEDEVEGAFDDHVWTSPSNAIKMVKKLESELEKINPEKTEVYKENAESYIAKIKEVDSKIQEIVDNKVRNRLLFGDKMPMQYFIEYYDLEVTAAFDGCNAETEPSASTIAYLEKVVREQKIPVVLYIELNNGRVAKAIADETGAKAMQIQTLHNLSLDDFNNGETWVSLMSRNLDVLKAALQ